MPKCKQDSSDEDTSDGEDLGKIAKAGSHVSYRIRTCPYRALSIQPYLPTHM